MPQTTSESRERKRRPCRKYAGVQILAFFFSLYVFAFFSWLLPLRPSYSESEKRELTKFPAFSFASLFDGSFFDGINTWFADTFPFREGLISLNGRMQNLYGFSTAQVHGDVIPGEEIPDAPMSEAPSSGTAEANAAVPSSSEEPKELNLDGVPTQSLSALLIVGDSAYEYYNFVQSVADTYITAVNSCAASLEGTATVYDIVVPLSMDVRLPESFRKTINTSDQKKAIEYMYSSMREGIKKVDAYGALKSHSDEYLYFRTDHHWTALGAYYSYRAFAEAKGITPAELSAFTEAQYPGYLGSFYSESGKNASLAANPDTVYTYTPADTNDITITTASGVEYNAELVADATDYDNANKYIAFIGGDNPYSVIRNPNLTDGSTCVVVKESFGNALVPFLVPNYQNIYVIDYRYYHKVKSGGIPALVREVGAQDVLFINNISATRNKSLMSYLANLCQ
ncbi:MAG: DHHW family protein [Candidatus Howiella sp.]|jgi:hypothetical protein